MQFVIRMLLISMNIVYIDSTQGQSTVCVGVEQCVLPLLPLLNEVLSAPCCRGRKTKYNTTKYISYFDTMYLEACDDTLLAQLNTD